MAAIKADGGAAFPGGFLIQEADEYAEESRTIRGDAMASLPRAARERGYRPGMTLRDWFAGQALSGVLDKAHGKYTREAIAEASYMYADAMLAARTPAEHGEEYK